MPRRVVLESVFLLLLVSVLIFLGSRTRSEATATLEAVEQPQPSELPTPPAAAKRLLTIAVRHAYEPPLLDDRLRREFRVDVLRNRDLMLVCKAENDALAVEICNRSVKEAQGTGLFMSLTRARETTPIGRRIFDAAWPALLAAFGWFLVRTSFKPRAGDELLVQAEPAGEWQSWSMPKRRLAVEEAMPARRMVVDEPMPKRARVIEEVTPKRPVVVEEVTPKRPVVVEEPTPKRALVVEEATPTSPSETPRSSRRPPIVNTVVGMPAVKPVSAPPLMASGAAMPERKPVLDTRTTARMLRVPKDVRVRSEAPPTSSTPPERERRRISTTPDLSRRVLYHVNNGPWVADASVVHDDALEQLASLREDVARRASTSGCVVRVTGGSNARYAKTQIATQLAWSLAERDGLRVLLMEADQDAPALHKALRVNVPRGFGFSEQLERLRDEGDAAVAAPTVMRLAPTLHVLVEGRSGSPALFDSPQFSAALAQLRSEHPVIVIDGPVVDTWPDSAALRTAAQIVAFVVPSSTSASDAMALSNRHFEHHPMLRVVKTG